MNNQREVIVGEIVISQAGRDRGNPFVVVWQEGELLGLCDGKLHKAGHIKKKKRKHVQTTGRRMLLSSDDLDNRDGTFDAKIRRALRDILEQGR